MLVPRKKIFDVLVVGSGASGGWVAKEASEHGLSVLMLEAGPPRVPTRDFTEHIWPYQLKFRGFGDQQRLLEDRQRVGRARLLLIAGWSFIAGVLIFSGSLYALALTGTGMFGAITPIGGVGLLLGWACLAFFAAAL